MPIRPSASAEIRHLIESLGGTDDVARESAIARLAVIGPRAVDHLLHAFPGANGRERAAILRALERLADPRGLPAARAALSDGSAAVQTAAIGVLRSLLPASTGDTARDALDALVAVALDRSRISELRIIALDALHDLPSAVRQPLEAALAGDPDPAIRSRLGAPPRRGESEWREAAAGRLPATPAELRKMVAAARSTARLTELQHLVDHIRLREQREPEVVAREEWRAVRGAVHQALAARNSRLALYDLRDSLMDADRLPVAFLAALEEIGDATCLEPLAAAYDASSRSGDAWWREHVAAAFRAIVQREALTRRHAAVKRAMARWPEAAADLMARV